jgi:hypothetical protein
MSEPRPQLPRARGAEDPSRQRHGPHFDHCEATGRYSGIYYDCFSRDMESHLLAVLRELETRAAMVLAGEPRRRVLSLLYDRQDNEPWSLVSFFIQTSDAETPRRLGFGHVGAGLLGITDPERWQRHLDEFRESVWQTVIREGRLSRRSAP